MFAVRDVFEEIEMLVFDMIQEFPLPPVTVTPVGKPAPKTYCPAARAGDPVVVMFPAEIAVAVKVRLCAPARVYPVKLAVPWFSHGTSAGAPGNGLPLSSTKDAN